MSDNGIVVVAGAAGDLGHRIAAALIARGAEVRAPVAPNLSPDKLARIAATGAAPIVADPADEAAMVRACSGADCVVSALNGTREVIIGRQGRLLDAAVKAGVPRLIPSDFAADFTKTRPGRNRNFDLRREFKARVDRAPIRATSILNGAFLDMLGAEMPLIQPRIHRVLYWHDADQPLDFTTKHDVAAYAAAAALDDDTPRILRIAGDTVSVRAIARILTQVSGEKYKLLRAGGMVSLGLMIAVAKRLAPGADEAFPPWQGMQYMRDQFSGDAQLSPLDTQRYPGVTWTSVREHLARRAANA